MDEYYGIDRSRYETTTPEQLELLEEEEERQRQAQLNTETNRLDNFVTPTEDNPTTPAVNPTLPNGMPQPTEEPSGLRTQAEIDKDNMSADEYGPGQVLLEWRDAIAAGGLKGYEDILTVPERYQDMMAGENVGSPDYKPDWNPLADTPRPILKTWWGPIVSEASRGATIASAVFLAARTGGAKFAQGTTAGGAAVRGMGYAGVEGLIDSNSQQESITTTLFTQVPFLKNIPVKDAPSIGLPGGQVNLLAPTFTYETDHPLLKTAKNVIENIGITGVFEGLITSMGAPKKATQASESINAQRLEKAQVEVLEDFSAKEADGARQIFNAGEGEVQFDDLSREVQGGIVQKLKDDGLIEPDPDFVGTFRGSKNKPIADDWQGNPMSGTGRAYDVAEQAAVIHRDPSARYGSTDSWTTPLQAERMAQQSGLLPEHIRKTTQDLLGDERMQAIKDEFPWTSNNEIWASSVERMQEVMGREVAGMDPEEFWRPIFDRAGNTGGDYNLAYWAREDIPAADLINAELMTQIRDIGVAMREVQDIADLEDIDGPLKALTDRYITGIQNVRMSRRIWGVEGQKLKAKDPKAAAMIISDIAKEEHDSARFAAEYMVDLIRNDASDDTVKAFAEFFSHANKIQNHQDLHAYLTKRLSATGMGEPGSGVLMRELGSVQINSILSGVRTPQRAGLGTGVAAVMRPTLTAIGALPGAGLGSVVQRDQLRASLASLNAMRQTIPEALEIFTTRLRGYWAGDIATINNRFVNYSKAENEWAVLAHHIENGPDVNAWDRIAFKIADTARGLNNSKWLTWSTKTMSAIDDGFRPIMARARSREVAMKKALNEARNGATTDVNTLLRRYDDEFYKTLLDADGNIDIDKDTVLKGAYQEATLTQDLSGFGAAIENLSKQFPPIAPWFRFMRTGVNGLNFSYKHMPALGLAHRQSLDIMRATADDLSLVTKYGITNADDLNSAKALLAGRQAFGTGITFTVGQAYLDGNLTGDGPFDPRMKQVWIDSGWKPRHIRVNGVWIDYSPFEPFATLMSTIANIGDNAYGMGPEWAEKNLAQTAFAVGIGAVSKTYTQGFQDLISLFSSGGQRVERVAGSLANSFVPFSSLRNDVSKILTPYMREINGSIEETVRNRNTGLELIAEKALPIKYDLLDGSPLRDWNFWQRTFNAVSGVNMSIEDDSPGRTLLFDSNYNYAIKSFRYNNVDMTDHPEVRSMFQRAIGNSKIVLGNKTYKNPLEALDAIALRPEVQESLRIMEANRGTDMARLDPKQAYLHNKLINEIFGQAQRRAWASIQDDPQVQALIEKKRKDEVDLFRTKQSTIPQRDVAPILNLPYK